MTEKTPNDPLFARMMQHSRLEMPFGDFDDRVMSRVNREASLKRSLSHNTRLSMLFFVLGTGFGLLMAHLLSQSGNTLGGIPTQRILTVFEVGYVLLISTQLESIIGLFRKLKRSDQ